MDSAKNPFLDMSQDQIQKIEAVLQLEQAKALLQESSDAVKLFENPSEKESLDITSAADEEHLPVLDETLEVGLNDLEHVFEHDSSQVLFTEATDHDVELNTELLHDDFNEKTMDLDVILMDHCYTVFPEDLLKNSQLKQTKNENLSEETNSSIKKEIQHRSSIASLRRSQRQLDKYQREQVEKIKAENAELQRREKEEMEKRRAQAGNDQQKEKVFDKNINIEINEEITEKKENEVPHEAIASDINSPSIKDKNARKSIQQKKLSSCENGDDKNSNNTEVILSLTRTDENQKEEIIENIVADIQEMGRQSQDKKSPEKKKKKQSPFGSSNKIHKKTNNIKMKKSSNNKVKHCKGDTGEKSYKDSPTSDNKFKETKNSKESLNDTTEDKLNMKIKEDTKLPKGTAKKVIKKIHSRRESNISLTDEPALFSQPDVMVKRKTSIEEGDNKKDKTMLSDCIEEAKTNFIDNMDTKTKVSDIKKEKIAVSEEDKKLVTDSTKMGIEKESKLLDKYLLNDSTHENQTILSPVNKLESLDIYKKIGFDTGQIESKVLDTISEVTKSKMKDEKEMNKDNENKMSMKYFELNEKGYKQLHQQISDENKKDINEDMLQKEKIQQEINQDKIIATNLPLKEKTQKQSNQEKMVSDSVKIMTDDHHQKEKGEKSSQQQKCINENKKTVNEASNLKEKAQKLNNQESRKSVGEKFQLKEKGQKEANYQKIIHEPKKIHHTGNNEVTIKKLHLPEVKCEQERKATYSSQNKISTDLKTDVQEKKHYTRYSIGKIKGNKYIKMLTGKGFSEDLENQTEEDDPEKLWCICRQPYDERFMIQCDNCEDWFHGNCVGVTQQQGRQLEKSKQEWWCPKCLEGMADDPVQAINSGDFGLEVPKSSLPKQAKEKNKPEKTNTNVTSAHRTANNLVANKPNVTVRKTVKENITNETAKSVSTPHAGSKNESKPISPSVKKDANRPEPVRLNVRNTLKGILTSRCHDANDVDVSENHIKCIAGYIEEELYKLFKDTGSKYKSKYRSLMFNIKDPRNQGLYRKIVKGIITPEQLVKMTPEELASTELAKWRERESKHMLEMIKREQIVQQQAALTQVIKKTHKGEVEVDEDSKIPEQKSLKQLPEEAPELIMDTTDKHRSHLFDLNCKICTGKMAPPKEDKSIKKVRIAHAISKEEQADQEQISTLSKIESKTLEEPDTDEITDQEVSSTLRSPDSTVSSYFSSSIAQAAKNAISVWKGFIAMQDIAKFVTAAYNVSGATDTLEQDIPDSIQVCGRIVPDQVWDYLTKIKQSVNKDIIIIRFAPANDEEKTPYGTLYSYLNSRKRYGVVGNCSRMIKDFYIMPLASYTPVPTVLMPFKGPGLDSARPHLLLGVIVRHTSKPRQSTTQSRVSKTTSKMPERSYTPPLETMPSSSDESMSQTSTKSSLKRTPLSDEYEPYEPSFTPPLEKMPKLDCDDTSQNRDFYEDKPYDPEDDNFVTGVSQSMKSKILNDTSSSDSLEHEKRLLIELTKKVEEEKQQIEKSLKLTNSSLIGKSQLPSQSPISQKYKLESGTELHSSTAEVNAFQIPGLGDGWQLTTELNTAVNTVPNEETNTLHVTNNLNDMLYKVKENLQNSTKREVNDVKSSEVANDFQTGSNKSSLEEQYNNLSKESVIDSQTVDQSQQEDGRAKVNENYSSTSKGTGKSSLSSMSASELLLKAQEQLEEMENAQKLQNAQSNYWTAMQQQASMQSNIINTEPLNLPSYSSNSFSQNISEHYLPHTENHLEHYTSTSESQSMHYSSHSEHHSFHYEEHSNHNQRYYSRGHRSAWNQQGRSSGRYHRYRRKHWTPSSQHHHHKHKGWYHRHDADRH